MSNGIRTLVGDADPEALTAHRGARRDGRALPSRLSLACSFQKEEAVLLDMLLAIEPDARVFALDTHVLFPETYDVWRAGREALRHPGRGLRGPVARPAGSNPRRRAVGVQPVALLRDPQGRRRSARRSPASTAGSPACAASSRRPARSAPKLGLGRAPRALAGEPARGLDRGGRSIAYISERELPVNALHARGYASIGCTHCTEPGTGREGRWSGTGKTECGLHADL